MSQTKRVIQVNLDKFQARPYQEGVFDALENKGYKRLVVVWPRRAGKDIVGFNAIIRQAFKRVGTYFYVFPTFSSGRRILWDAITNEGMRILDYLPEEVIESKNEMMMRIRLKNGSQICVLGSDNFDKTIIGTNCVGFVFSEYALQDENVWAYSKMIVEANDGFALFLSTPRSKNHLYSLWQIAIANPDVWYSNILTVKETQHVSEEKIQSDIDRGEISWDLARQEWYCDFSLGIDGAVFGTALDRMKLNEQITNVPWQPNHPVYCAWDVGNDGTAIVFYQAIGQTFNIIDYYENSGHQLEFYINYINTKEYNYKLHWFPHDMRVTEWGGQRYTRLEKARQLGIKGDIVDSVLLEDGIEYVKSNMAKIWIDAKKCEKLVTCLENYRYEYDRKKSCYKNIPLHDKYSHGCDALRYACLSFPKSKDGMTQADVDKIRAQALYGNQGKLPEFFRDNVPWRNDSMF